MRSFPAGQSEGGRVKRRFVYAETVLLAMTNILGATIIFRNESIEIALHTKYRSGRIQSLRPFTSSSDGLDDTFSKPMFFRRIDKYWRLNTNKCSGLKNLMLSCISLFAERAITRFSNCHERMSASLFGTRMITVPCSETRRGKTFHSRRSSGS